MAAINLPIVSKFDDKGVRQATSAFDGISSNLGKIAGLIGAAFSVRAITNFAKESITAAEGVAVANARIDQIAKSMNLFGEETQAVADRLKSYAEANELTLATDAEVIKATQAKLLTFRELGLTADEAGGAFDRATAAAIDLAAAGFGSAETNAVQLGKALQDPIKGISALRRAGITFTEAEKEKIATLVESGNMLEAQNLVLAAIETQVGGTAAATATASQKMQLAFDNVKETVGAALMPAFASLAEAMIPIAEEIAPILATAIEDLTPTLSELAGFIPEVVEAFAPLIPSLISIIGAIAQLAVELMPLLIEVFDALVPVIEDLLPIILEFFQDAIEPLIPAIVDLVEGFGPLISSVLPVIARLLEAVLPLLITLLEDLFIPLIPVIVDVVEAFLPLLEYVLPILAGLLERVVLPALLFLVDILKFTLVGAVGILTGVLQGLGDFFEWLGGAITATWNDTVKAVNDGLNALSKFFSDTFVKIRDTIIKGVSGFATLLFRAGQDLITGLVDGIANFGSKIGRALIDVVDSGVKGVKDFLGIRSPSKVFFAIGEDVTTGLADGINNSAYLVKDAADQLATYTTSAASKIETAFDKSITVISSIPGIAGKSMEETVKLTVDQVRRMAEETEGLFATFDKKGNLLQSYTGMGQQVLIPDVTGEMFDVGRATDDLNAIYRYMGANTIEAMEEVQNSLFGGSFQQAIDALTGQTTVIDPRTGMSTTIGGTPESVAAAVERAIAKGMQVVTPLGTTITELKDRITSVSSQVAEKGLLPIGLAKGGFVDQATLAVVGEGGPEVVMPLDRFESTLQKYSGGMGDQYTYNVNVNAGMGSDPVSIGREVVNAIKRYESVSGRVFVSA